MSCSSVASLVTHFHNQISNDQILVCSLLCTRGPACRHKSKDAIDFLTLCVLYAFVSWPFLFAWPINHDHCGFFLNFFFYPYSVVDWTDINWKCHELSGKCVYGLCGDRSELALPALRAFTWMSVECEENVFYHTAAPPPIALTSSSDENVTAAGTLQSWTSIKMGIRSERQRRQSTFSSQPSRCLIITRPPISLSPLIDCSYFGFFHADQILRALFFFKAHFGATAAWF